MWHVNVDKDDLVIKAFVYRLFSQNIKPLNKNDSFSCRTGICNVKLNFLIRQNSVIFCSVRFCSILQTKFYHCTQRYFFENVVFILEFSKFWHFSLTVGIAFYNVLHVYVQVAWADNNITKSQWVNSIWNKSPFKCREISWLCSFKKKV